MSKPLEQVEADALELPIRDRAHLAQTLLASLDEDSEIEQAWEAEIQRREQDIDSGRVSPIPGDQAFDELDKFLK
jgi:putative addiction module component (TIGR02574 family)